MWGIATSSTSSSVSRWMNQSDRRFTSRLAAMPHCVCESTCDRRASMPLTWSAFAKASTQRLASPPNCDAVRAGRARLFVRSSSWSVCAAASAGHCFWPAIKTAHQQRLTSPESGMYTMRRIEPSPGVREGAAKMPRYYFHIEHGQMIVLDHAGADLVSLDTAVKEAA